MTSVWIVDGPTQPPVVVRMEKVTLEGLKRVIDGRSLTDEQKSAVAEFYNAAITAEFGDCGITWESEPNGG